MSAPSVWWPVPHRPERWFSADELSASADYHAPMRRSAIVKTAAQVGLVAGLGFAVSALTPAGLNGWLLVAAGVAVAWWVPAAVADVWFEFRHESRFGHDPLPAGRFAVSSAVTLVAALAVTAVIAVLLRFVIDRWPETWWLWSSLLISLVAAGLGALGPLIAVLGGQVDLNDAAVEEDHQLAAVLDRLALDVRFAHFGPESVVGLNAMAMGMRNTRVVMSEDLRQAPPEVRRHVIVHELSHVRHRDVITTAVVTVVVESVALMSAWWLVSRSAPDWTEPRSLPLLTLAGFVAVSIARLPLTWLSRAHERRADLDAHRLSGPTAEWVLRQLHITERADLDPPRWVGLVASHPSPGERLELAALCGALAPTPGRVGHTLRSAP